MGQVHATCVAIEGGGVLIRGESGIGKSDLALRLIDHGGQLVADDRVELNTKDGHVIASVPTKLAGKLEVRGLGIIDVDCVGESRVDLVVDLTIADELERHPDICHAVIVGVEICCIALNPSEASAAAKVRIAMRRLQKGI